MSNISETANLILSLSKGYVKYSTLVEVMSNSTYSKNQFDQALTAYINRIREEQKADLGEEMEKLPIMDYLAIYQETERLAAQMLNLYWQSRFSRAGI